MSQNTDLEKDTEIARLHELMFEQGHCDGPDDRSRSDIDDDCHCGCPWIKDNHCEIDGWEIPE
jgi:hypothetical protein